jgi:hypothetical protein
MRASQSEHRPRERSARDFGRWLASYTILALVFVIAAPARAQETFFKEWLHAFDEPSHPIPPSPSSSAKGELLVVDRHSHVPIPDSERPAEMPDDIGEKARPIDLGPSKTELQELSQWVRWIALKNLPPNIEDNRKWGKRRRVYDGVDMHWEGMRLDTKRRWKMVNDGTWSRYFIEWIDPANRLEINVLSLDFWQKGRGFSSRIRIVAPLKIFARVSQFQRDVQLISLSMQADATVALEIDLEVGIRVNPLVFPPDMEFRPKATRADVQLLEFEMHRLSQIRGDVAEWLGKGLRGILDRKISETNDKLVLKINDSFAKQQDRLRLSAHEWIKSSFSLTNPTKDRANKDANKPGE